jgi:hypothetical protein
VGHAQITEGWNFDSETHNVSVKIKNDSKDHNVSKQERVWGYLFLPIVASIPHNNNGRIAWQAG